MARSLARICRRQFRYPMLWRPSSHGVAFCFHRSFPHSAYEWRMILLESAKSYEISTEMVSSSSRESMRRCASEMPPSRGVDVTRWYQTWWAKIGLRVAGIAFLISAWLECGLLRRLVWANPATDMTGAQFLLGVLMFLSASSGAALTILGGRLWKPVQLSDRWTDGPTPRELKPALNDFDSAGRENGLKKSLILGLIGCSDEHR